MELRIVPYYFCSILGSKTNKNVGYLFLVEESKILSCLSKRKLCDLSRNHPQAPRVHLSSQAYLIFKLLHSERLGADDCIIILD